MFIPKINTIRFMSNPIQTDINTLEEETIVGKNRVGFFENHDMTIEEITSLDDKVKIGRAPGKPQYPPVNDENPNNYTFNEQAMARDVEFLKVHCNVDTIIDLRNPIYEGNKFEKAERNACEMKGVKYINIQLDSGIAPTDEEIDTLLRAIDSSKGSVYIHCHAGRDRTGIMSSCYLADKYGCSTEEAFKTVFDDRNVQRLKFMYGQPQECKKLEDKLTDLANKAKNTSDKVSNEENLISTKQN